MFGFSIAQAQTSHTGMATYFDGIGAPFGGCGVPESEVETMDYVALNVFNTPGQGTSYPRPLTGADLSKIGEFQNGNNCGRWLKVTIMENCVGGTNDGALGQVFCRGAGATWAQDKYFGSQLNMIVTDACGDANGWCRDSPYHLDLHTTSLDKFDLNGQKSVGMYPTNFNNRKVKWEYMDAPNYTGDIKIHVMQGGQRYYAPVLITNLKNGIHKLEQKVNGTWVTAARNGDMGQAFLLPDVNAPYTIRITDANDKLVNNGREYTFGFPSSCGSSCTAPSTKVTYTTFTPVVTDIDENIFGNWNLGVSKNSFNETEIFLGNIPIENLTYKIYDLSGKEITNKSIHSIENNTVSIKMNQSGLYIFHLLSEDKLISTTKFYEIN